MKTKVYFKYKGEQNERPDDYGPVFEIPFSEAPNIGDTVFLEYPNQEKCKNFKVLTKHFLYYTNSEGVTHGELNIVITDVSNEEMASRVKE